MSSHTPITVADGSGLAGKFLVATPQMGDPRFARAVVYLCNHDEDGAMGIIINKTKPLPLSQMLGHIGIEGEVRVADTAVLSGGPVDTNRGFVLHSPDFSNLGNSLHLSDTLVMTSSKDVLESLVADNAPSKAVLAVGYSGWSDGQLASELQANAWLVVEGDEALIFDTDMESKWERALSSAGISPNMLSAGGSA
jgi:putative transcriptional regulator